MHVGRKRKKRLPEPLDHPDQCRGARTGFSHSVFMRGLKAAGIELDRKQLAELAAREPAAFAKIVEKAKAAAA